jgi:hypothetical protein
VLDVAERVQERVGGVQISVAGRPVRSETTATAAGPSVLVLITALGELGVTVTSSYIGHQGTETIAAHLIVTRHREELERVEHCREALPVSTRASAACSTMRRKSRRR